MMPLGANDVVSKNLAAGILITCSCGDDRYIIFGLSAKKGKLANFHGWGEKNEDDPKVTALREFGEESLNAICDRDKVSFCLRNQDYYRMILPCQYSLVDRVKCYWVHLGEITKEEMVNVKERFQENLKQENLTDCQKEVKELVFVDAKELKRVLGPKNYHQRSGHILHPCIKEKERGLKLRQYIQEYISHSFYFFNKDENARSFTRFCDGDNCDIKSVLEVKTTLQKEEEKEGNE